MSEQLEQNLLALNERWPDTVAKIRAATAVALSWSQTREPDRATATLQVGEKRISLASRYRPSDDADRLAASADIDKHAVILILGFGLGYHIRALADATQDAATLLVYEPDPALLAAVLSQVDCRDIFAQRHVAILTGPIDHATIIRDFEGNASNFVQGLQILTYPPTRQMQGDACREFLETMNRFMDYCRMNIATMLSQSATTCRNLSHNLWRYAAGSTVNELVDAAKGRPAVLVSAGPSLAKNVHLLKQEGVRDRVLIIAVQTVLKPLLDRGIEPHFVTALDYHEISKRFYEGVPELRNTTLVAEPKANEHILRSYPGPIRVLRNEFLDRMLGPLARPIAPMPAGATVAHLSLYLAQLLGCDPIILIGQDLGFSEGLYYCPGTAIHDVWAPEYNVFNTVEMLEWKRIARHKAHLHRRQDIHDRPIYSDQQMISYLNQFERDFLNAKQTIIDATEGGLPKQHTTIMTLADALAQYATQPLPALPTAERVLPREPIRLLAEQLSIRREQILEVRNTSEATVPMLKDMCKHQRDNRKMESLFEKVEKKKKKIEELQEVFKLVNALNQIGVFRRGKADRAIKVSDSEDPYEKQRKQLERDIDNISWLVHACDEAKLVVDEAVDRITEALASEQWTREGAA